MVEVLIATLGTKPQVVTITLDSLIAQGHTLGRLVVLHTDPTTEPIATALARLRYALRRDYPLLPATFEELRDGDGPLIDLVDAQTAAAYFRGLHRVILAHKRRGHTVHLLGAGGRKAMSMYTALSAQLLFDAHDRLWTLISPPDLVASDAMHDAAGVAALVRVPVPLSGIVPGAYADPRLDDPFSAVVRHEYELRQRRQNFIQRWLTPAERKLARALLAAPRETTAQVAARLGKSKRTVDHQLGSIYAKLDEFLSYRVPTHDKRRLLLDVLGAAESDAQLHAALLEEADPMGSVAHAGP
ncbi:MAG: hypothetical protein Kow00120_29980 [Anaerolineae bacterium]